MDLLPPFLMVVGNLVIPHDSCAHMSVLAEGGSTLIIPNLESKEANHVCKLVCGRVA